MPSLKACLLLTLCCTPALAQAPLPTPIVPNWQDPPAPAGTEAQWLVGSANGAGIYAQRVRLQQGARVAPHTHNDERFSVVLSGTIYVGFGETFDESQVVAIPTGGVYIAPAGVAHYVWARDGVAEYQESGIGPTSTNFIGN